MERLFIEKRWLSLYILVAALLLLSGGVAYAAVSVQKTIPSTISVDLESTPMGALGLYADEGGTIPVTTLDFGILKPGVTGMASVYVRNLTAATTFQSFSATDDLDKAFVTISPQNIPSPYFFAQGTTIRVDFFLQLDPDIPPGAHQFTVTMIASGP